MGETFYTAMLLRKGGITCDGKPMASFSQLEQRAIGGLILAAQEACLGKSAAECFSAYEAGHKGLAWDGTIHPAWATLRDQDAWEAGRIAVVREQAGERP